MAGFQQAGALSRANNRLYAFDAAAIDRLAGR